MSNTVRAFIAIEMPNAVISALAGLQQDLKSMRLNVRWVRPANIHLTLTFLGDIQLTKIGAIADSMTDAAGGIAPFRLTLRGLGFFPGVRRPRVMWVGLGGDTRCQQGLDFAEGGHHQLAGLADFTNILRAF